MPQDFTPDYSQFPFDDLSDAEITQLMMDSFRVGDTIFASACREEIKHRKPDNAKGSRLVDVTKPQDTAKTNIVA